jgi:hypothetical protein
VVHASNVLVATLIFGLAMSVLCGWFATRGAIRTLVA